MSSCKVEKFYCVPRVAGYTIIGKIKNEYVDNNFKPSLFRIVATGPRIPTVMEIALPVKKLLK